MKSEYRGYRIDVYYHQFDWFHYAFEYDGWDEVEDEPISKRVMSDEEAEEMLRTKGDRYYIGEMRNKLWVRRMRGPTVTPGDEQKHLDVMLQKVKESVDQWVDFKGAEAYENGSAEYTKEMILSPETLRWESNL